MEVLKYNIDSGIGVYAEFTYEGDSGGQTNAVEVMEAQGGEDDIYAGTRHMDAENQGNADSASQKAEQLRKNAKRGREYEEAHFGIFKRLMQTAEEQITVAVGARKLRLDAIGIRKSTGEIEIREYKSSRTAKLNPNQAAGFLELERFGGEVVGKGKGVFRVLRKKLSSSK